MLSIFKKLNERCYRITNIDFFCPDFIIRLELVIDRRVINFHILLNSSSLDNSALSIANQ